MNRFKNHLIAAGGENALRMIFGDRPVRTIRSVFLFCGSVGLLSGTASAQAPFESEKEV
jgi:hypothetical protein